VEWNRLRPKCFIGQASYIQAVFGVTITGLATGSSSLYPKSSTGLHTFGSTPEVIHMMNILLESEAVQGFVKTSILYVPFPLYRWSWIFNVCDN
jgi:hypothetical protein